VRYMTSRDVQLTFWNDTSLLPARKDFYEDPENLHLRPDLEQIRDLFTKEAVARPSTIAGKRYAEVSRAYFTAVHSILKGEVSAEKAMADLETELGRITGFKPGLPRPRQRAAAATN
jgi:trehalose/maltose transport system substrate-binding protein